jgi:acetylornithine deacetylase/succinyl-diaminopimelate desuccinylase-like protein
VNVSRKRLVTDTSRLVQIPSWLECDTIARHVLREIKAIGIAGAHRDKAGNVIATLGSGGPGLLLNAHLDTVPPGDYVGDPCSGRVVGGRVLGRGSSDDKAGVTAMLEIARILKSRQLNQRVTLAFTVWEEATGLGPNGSYQAARDARATRAIILESTMSAAGRTMGVNVGCKGNMKLLIDIKGKAYHAARPEKGENAVYRAARIIAAFEKLFAPDTMPTGTYRVGRRDITMRNLATATEVEATQGINVIPGDCQIRVNCRLLPDGDDAEVLRRTKKLQSMFPKGWVRWRTERRILGHLCEDDGLIDICVSAIRDEGLRATTGIMSGRADSTIFQATGNIQSVVMGPGTIGTAHTKNEYVTTDSLTIGTKVVLRAVEALVCD